MRGEAEAHNALAVMSRLGQRLSVQFPDVQSGDRLMKRVMWTLVLLTFLPALAMADDWPGWLGPKRDGIWRETGILDKFPEAGLKPKWRAPLGTGYSGPAVVGDRVYVMDRV